MDEVHCDSSCEQEPFISTIQSYVRASHYERSASTNTPNVSRLILDF